MNNARLTTAALIATAALSLTACLPETEISQESLIDILSVNTPIEQVAELAAKSFQNIQINNPSLQPYLTTHHAANITGACAGNRGSYLFSKSADNSLFSLVLDRCANVDGEILDGSLSGTFVNAYDTYSMSMTGSLTASKDDLTIDLEAMTMTFEFSKDKTGPTFYLTHSGTYSYHSSHYKGVLTVTTNDPVGMNGTTLETSGQVSFIDDSGNQLLVEHTNNGIHLYLNNVYFYTYSHSDWHALFG